MLSQPGELKVSGVLDGKVAVVTGGTRGLGLNIAQAFSQAGAAVVVASRSPETVARAVRSIQDTDGRASGLVVDVSNLDQVEELAQHAVSQFGRLDIWVNNAGIAGPYGPTSGLHPKDFQQIMETNILGVYYGSRTALQVFLPQRSGKLINLLGHGYNRPLPWQNAYGSSKAWVHSFTLALAAETRDSGVGVFAFAPGMLLTELLTDVEVIEGSEERLKIFPTIVRMWAKPASVAADKAVWLASAATDGKTGLVVSLFSPWVMLRGAIKEGWRRALRQPEPDLDVRWKTIPPYQR